MNKKGSVIFHDFGKWVKCLILLNFQHYNFKNEIFQNGNWNYLLVLQLSCQEVSN